MEQKIGKARMRCPSLYRFFPREGDDWLGISAVWGVLKEIGPSSKDDLVSEMKSAITKEGGDEYKVSYLSNILSQFKRLGLIEESESNDLALPKSISDLNMDSLALNPELGGIVLDCLLERWGSDDSGEQYLLELLMAVWSSLPSDSESSLNQKEITDNLRRRGWDTSYSKNVWNRGLKTSLSLMIQVGMIERKVVVKSPHYSRTEDGSLVYQRLRGRSVLIEYENAIDRLGSDHGIWEPGHNFDPCKDGQLYFTHRFTGGLSEGRKLAKKLRRGLDRLQTKLLEEFYLKDLERLRGEGLLSKPPKSEKPTKLRTLLQTYQGVLRDGVCTKFGILEESNEYRLLHSSARRITIDFMTKVMQECESDDEARVSILGAAEGRVRRFEVDKVARSHPDGRGKIRSDSESHPATRWQVESVEDWLSNDIGRGPEGIVAAVTGTGKTVMAIRAVSEFFEKNPGAIASVIVPTRVLMSQWGMEFAKFLGFGSDVVGYRGDDEKDSFKDGKRIIVWVINSAAQDDEMQRQVASVESPHLLIADECHRYGGEEYNKVFQDSRMPDGKLLCNARLGLSATPPEREDLEQIDEDEVVGIHGNGAILDALGECICEMTYADALEEGLVSPFAIRYLGIPMDSDEDSEYDRLSKKIKKARDKIHMDWPELDRFGNMPLIQQLNRYAKRNPAINEDGTVKSFRTLTNERLDVIAGARYRKASMTQIFKEQMEDDPGSRFIVFHQKISQLDEVFSPRDHRDNRGAIKKNEKDSEIDSKLGQMWNKRYGRKSITPTMYHSKLGDSQKKRNMEMFRNGRSNAMLSVRALDEGLDVPDANIGIIRVSGSSTRPLLQRIGRMLRRSEGKEAVIWIFYVTRKDGSRTGDCSVLKDRDWHKQLGSGNVHYLKYVQDQNEVTKMEEGEIPFSSPTMILPLEVPIEELIVGEAYPGRPVGDEYKFDSKGRIVVWTKLGDARSSPSELEGVARELLEATGGRGGRVISSPQGHISTWVKDRGERIYLGTIERKEMSRIVERISAGKMAVRRAPSGEKRLTLAEIIASKESEEETRD